MIKIYVTHSIRGQKGLNATEQDMIENCNLAMEFGNWLRKNYPGVEFYVPGDHEEFVRIAWMNNLLTEKEILSVDCEIILGCCGVIVYAPDGHISRGMKTEIDYAEELEIPILEVKNTGENFILEKFLKGLGYNG
jgi:hypothetical protein